MTADAPQTYDEFAAKAHGGRGQGGTKWIDDAPDDIGELANYFLSITPGQLAGCWVACIVDAAHNGWNTGDVARALTVVAARLHGVKFDMPPKGVLPVSQAPTRAEALRREMAATPPKPADGPKTVEGFEIHTGEPPAEKPKHTRGDQAKVMAAAAALPLGGWFVWKDAKKTMNPVKMSVKLTQAVGFEVLVYRTVPGTVVVKRPAARGSQA